uniref:Reverse transcriptase domain-containing protein n=1 Tax=Strongyloides venezuelensis TaxID=75913 RepID=A0A0K0G1B3_STRVS
MNLNMAPPGLKVQKYEECLKPASYGRLLRLQISFLKEEKKIATLMNCLPKRWMDKLYRELLEEESEDYKLTSDYILKYVDKCVTEENKMTSIAVSIAKTIRIKFEAKKNAMSSFLEELIRSAEVIHSNKTVTETIAVMFFIQGISSKCKEDLITNNKLPTLAECREFALEKDLRYDERSFFNEGKDLRTNQTNFRMYEGSKSKELVRDNKKMVEKEKTENDDRKTELLTKQIKFQSVSNAGEATISIAQCKLDGLEGFIGFGMDSCASYCTIPTEIFNKFSTEVKEQYKNNRNEDVLLTSIHETTSITDGYIDTYITINGCPKIIEKRKIRLFIDPKSKLPLISFNFMCDNDIDPRWFRKENDCSNKSNKNLTGKYGITYGEFSKKFEEFLDEDESRILRDPSMIVENKITVELKVNDKYRPRRMHIIPVPIDLQKETKEILDDEVSRGWLTKLTDNEKADNTSPLIVVKRTGKPPRLCYSMLHVNRFIENPIMESLPSAKDLLLEDNIELISLFDIRNAYRSISLSN